MHLALTTAAFVLSAGSTFGFRRLAPILKDPAAQRILIGVACALAVGLLLVSRAVRARLAILEPGADAAVWWAGNRAKLLVLWALGLDGVVVGAVFWLLSGSLIPLWAAGGVGFYTLLAHSPARVTGAA